MAASADLAPGADLLMLLPDLFRDPGRILDEGPGLIDRALAHYLSELHQSMSSNRDAVEAVERASRMLLETAPTIAHRLQLLSSSSRTIFETNSDCRRCLHDAVMELAFSEKALAVVVLADLCRAAIVPGAGAVQAARQLIRSQAALSQLRDLVPEDDLELGRLERLVGAKTAVVVNEIVVGRTFFEYARFAKQTLTIDRRKAHLVSAFKESVAVLNAPEADLVYAAIQSHFWNEFFQPILDGVFIDVRCTSTDKIDCIKIRRPTLMGAVSRSGCEFALLRMRAIESVVQLILDKVFEGGTAVVAHLGRHLWPRLRTVMVERVLQPAVPSYSTRLGQYRAVMSPAVLEFMRTLQRCGFVPELSPPSSLQAFVDDLDGMFDDLIAARFLARARSALMDARTIWTAESGIALDDDVSDQVRELCDRITSEFLRDNPGAKVTRGAVHCAMLAHVLLDQAVDSTLSPRALAAHLLSVARNIMFVFRTVSPVYHEKLFSTEPCLRSLYAINCLMLSHHMARAVVIYNQPDLLSISNELSRAARIAFQSQRQWLLASTDHIRLRDKQIDVLDVLNVLYKFWRS